MRDMDCAQLASMMLADKRARQREMAASRPTGLHSQLKIINPEEVPPSFRDVMKGSVTSALTAKRLQGGGKAGGAAGGSRNVTVSKASSSMAAAYLGRGSKPPDK